MSMKDAEAAAVVHNGMEADAGEDYTSEVDEPTMNERLEELGMSAEGEENGLNGGAELNKELIDSKAAVVLQGLMSSDDNLLSSIICQKHDISVVRSTVCKLPPDVATGVLLEAISEKLRSQPRLSDNLIPWLREIVFEHSNSLVNKSYHDTVEKIIEFGRLRLENLNALTRLQGRLELVARRAQRAQEVKQSSVDTEAHLEYSMR